MKKTFTILLLSFLLDNTVLAESYYFKGCKLSNVTTGDYVINIDKKLVEATLMAADGRVQKFFDKIKKIEKDKIITEKIKSEKGEQIYFEYYLNVKTKKVIKLQYRKQSGPDIDIFKIQERKESKCSEVKGDWDSDKIKKAEIDKKKKEISREQEKIKKEQSSLVECEGNDYKLWTNCKGLYKAETGHKYDGLFKAGKIIKGTALFPGGA